MSISESYTDLSWKEPQEAIWSDRTTGEALPLDNSLGPYRLIQLSSEYFQASSTTFWGTLFQYLIDFTMIFFFLTSS